MKTIQYTNSEGTWQNLLGHDCTTEAEMNEYVAKLCGGNGYMRVAEHDAEGEVSSYVREERVTLSPNANPDAVLAVLAALRDTKW